MTIAERDLNELKNKFLKEVIQKRCINMKEDTKTSTAFVMNWKKEKPDSFEFLFNCWYKDNYVKGK